MSAEHQNCKYKSDYTDAKTEKRIDYECVRARTPTGDFCIFHDDEYFQQHMNEASELLIRELDATRHTPRSIYFIGCNIPPIEIDELDLSKSLYFANSKFHGDISFTEIQMDIIDFSDAKFYGNLTISHTHNCKKIILTGLRFDEDKDLKIKLIHCNFEEGKFILTNFKKLSIEQCKFGSINFRSSVFNKELSIEACDIDDANFSNCRFKGMSNFNKTSFDSIATFEYAEFQNLAEFQRTYFKKQQLVSFVGDMSNVSFLYSDITRVRFDEVDNWGKDNKIRDEREFIESKDKNNLKSILAIYRNLRDNYEFQLRYEDAGKFFIREMELNRKYKQKIDGSVEAKKYSQYITPAYFYKKFFNYGESLRKTLACLAILFATTFVVLFTCPDTPMLEQTKPFGELDYAKIHEDLELRTMISFKRAFNAFFQISTLGNMDAIFRVVALPFLAMTFIVLRRKYERKFRH